MIFCDTGHYTLGHKHILLSYGVRLKDQVSKICLHIKVRFTVQFICNIALAYDKIRIEFKYFLFL